jgi:acetyl esterase/lipase
VSRARVVAASAALVLAMSTASVGAAPEGGADKRAPATWADIQALPVPPAGQHIAYGKAPKQFGELRVPAGRGPHPVAILLHGGCWQSEYDLAYMKPLAASLARDGIATWSLEYRGIGDAGGGWPGTFEDVVAGSALLRKLAKPNALDLSRVVVVGHSAGGHLATWLAAKRRPPLPGAKAAGKPLALRGVVGLAPIVDLRAYAAAPGSCNESVVPLLGGSADKVPARYAATSPAELLPVGVPMRLIVGSVDPIVPRAHVEPFVARASGKGDGVTMEVVEGAGHFDLVLPTPPASTRVEAAIRALLK